MSRTNNLLIAEDNENISRLLEALFTRLGYTITLCANGLDALDAFKSSSPDLLVTDIRMPGLDGIELADAVREIDVQTPVLFLSGSLDEEDVAVRLRRELEMNPRSSFLRKPFSIQDLALKVEMMLRMKKSPATLPSSTAIS